jgi:hypothetical protein
VTVRTTIHLEDELFARVRQVVPPRGMSRFINQTIAEKLDALERQQVEEAMKEGYVASREDRAALSEDWGVLDTEQWPEWCLEPRGASGGPR